MFSRCTRGAFALALAACMSLGPSGVLAQSPPSGPPVAAPAAASAITGVVVDASTGLPLSGAVVGIVGTSRSATTDQHGAFAFPGVVPGRYQLRVDHSGYQPVVSDQLALVAGQEAKATLALQSAPTQSTLKTIGRTSTSAAQSLQKSSVIYRTLSAETLQEQGVYRVADALRQLPGVNNGITGDTASLGDDINLNIRGIGTLETTASLDGHPIAYGFPGGYNAQLSPVMPLRNIEVTYGSGGSDLLGVNAIGGVIDFQTIDPTPDRRITLSQGYGTWNKLSTDLKLTGTDARFGYAADFGVAGLDGPIRNSIFPQPGAAFDPSAPPGSYAYQLYPDDSGAVAKDALIKLRYDLSPASRITFTSTNESYWENKTGNGDGDYLPYPAALAFGQQQLAQYDKSHPPSAPQCPAGQFAPLNPFGVYYGTGPNGKPDGGVPCETPAQWAGFNAGWDGAGVAWQSFNFNDQHLELDTTAGRQNFRFDVFTNRYFNTEDRTFQLPFEQTPGDQASWRNQGANETGAVASDDFYTGPNNELGYGVSYLNTSYEIFRDASLRGAPYIFEDAAFLRDVFHPTHSPLALYTNINLRESSATNTSYIDPRMSLVYTPTQRDVVRVAAGATTTQPAANQLDIGYVQQSIGGAGGGAPINCSGTNSIGSAPSSILKPERGVDQELSYGHSFGGASQVQLELYNVNVYDKLYSTLIPLSQAGTGFIPPAFLTQEITQVADFCGVTPAEAAALLGVSGTVNVGQLQARGFTLSGRQRLDRRTFLDYDWDLDSTVLKSAPISLLQANLTDILGGQIPRLPLHTLNASLDHAFGGGIDARYTIHTVSVNNTKSLPAYNYSDLTASAPLARGKIGVTVQNLFNQNAFIEGLRYEGVPLPLNGFATAASYAQYTGANATELFGLPYRSVFFNYTIQTR